MHARIHVCVYSSSSRRTGGREQEGAREGKGGQETKREAVYTLVRFMYFGGLGDDSMTPLALTARRRAGSEIRPDGRAGHSLRQPLSMGFVRVRTS